MALKLPPHNIGIHSRTVIEEITRPTRRQVLAYPVSSFSQASDREGGIFLRWYETVPLSFISWKVLWNPVVLTDQMSSCFIIITTTTHTAILSDHPSSNKPLISTYCINSHPIYCNIRDNRLSFPEAWLGICGQLSQSVCHPDNHVHTVTRRLYPAVVPLIPQNLIRFVCWPVIRACDRKPESPFFIPLN